MAQIELNADTGNDTTGNGSAGLPYLTFAKALTVYNAGDTIYFQDATAEYSFLGNTITKNCTIEGESIDGVVQNGNGGFVGWKINNAVVTIKKMTLRNMYFPASGTYGYGLFNMYGMTDNTTVILEDIIIGDDMYLSVSSLGGFTGTFAIPTTKTATFEVRRVKGHVISTGTNSPLFSFRTGNAGSFLNWTLEDVTITIDPNGFGGYFYYLDNVANGTVTQSMTRALFANYTGETFNWRLIFNSSTWTVDSTVYLYGITSVHSSITSQGAQLVDPVLVDPDNGNYNLSQLSPVL